MSPWSNVLPAIGMLAMTPVGVVWIVQYTTSLTSCGDSTCTVE